MEKTVQLPSGNSAVFRNPNELRVKDRTKVLEGIGNAESQISQGLKLIDGIIALLVKEWSFDLIIPNVSINSLQELSIPDYDALSKAAEDARKVLFPSESEDKDNSPKDN